MKKTLLSFLIVMALVMCPMALAESAPDGFDPSPHPLFASTKAYSACQAAPPASPEQGTLSYPQHASLFVIHRANQKRGSPRIVPATLANRKCYSIVQSRKLDHPHRLRRNQRGKLFFYLL